MTPIPAVGALLVGVGGAVGTLARYGIDVSIGDIGGIPLGTLLVNLVGSLLIGIVVAAIASERRRLLLGTGFLGGFTTYSALAVQTQDLLSSDPRVAVGYALATVAGGLFLTLLGLAIGRRWPG